MNANPLTKFRIATVLFSSALILAGCSSDSGSQSTDSELIRTEVFESDQLTLVDDEATTETTGSTPAPVQASIEVANTSVRLTWQASTGASSYRILENPDGLSGFSRISSDITANSEATTLTFDHDVALFNRINAQYIVQACNANGCTDSETLSLAGTLESAISYIKASNTNSGDRFGSSIIISADGNTLAVGAPREDSLATGVNGDQSDNSARLSGSDTGTGAVYVFAKLDTIDGLGGRWEQQAYLKASNTRVNNPLNSAQPQAEFGRAMSLSADGSTLVVGAPNEDSGAAGFNGVESDDSLRSAGAVYVFVRSRKTGAINGPNSTAASRTIWQQQAYLKASNPQRDGYFGSAVSLSADGDTLAVGSMFEDSEAIGVNGNQTNREELDSGAVYMFGRITGRDGVSIVWQQQAYVKASNTEEGHNFGNAISLSANGDVMAVGAVGDESSATGIDGHQEDESFFRAGAVFMFIRGPSRTWTQQAYIKASNTDDKDQFGHAVALSPDGRTLAVGAFGESSASAGVNADQSDNSSNSAGAVYVFSVESGDWLQQAYLKASNTDQFDRFGMSVSLSTDGNTLAVGAIGEDSLARGLNGAENGNAGNSTGAVYLFSRSAGNWQQQSYVKASNTKLVNFSDVFGSAVSLSADGTSLAVGASGEGSAATGINGDQEDASAPGAGAVYIY